MLNFMFTVWSRALSGVGFPSPHGKKFGRRPDDFLVEIDCCIFSAILTSYTKGPVYVNSGYTCAWESKSHGSFVNNNTVPWTVRLQPVRTADCGVIAVIVGSADWQRTDFLFRGQDVAITMNSVKIRHAVRSAITAIAELLVLVAHSWRLRHGGASQQAAVIAATVICLQPSTQLCLLVFSKEWLRHKIEVLNLLVCLKCGEENRTLSVSNLVLIGPWLLSCTCCGGSSCWLSSSCSSVSSAIIVVVIVGWARVLCNE